MPDADPVQIPPDRRWTLLAPLLALVAAAGAYLALKTIPIPEPVRPGVPGSPEATAPLFEVPPFSFEERSGRTVAREDLRGRTWVVDFIFASCPGACPRMSESMGRVHELMRRDAGSTCVSITVDPERDTPTALRAYADAYGASADRWLFLRGTQEAAVRLEVEGFRMGDLAEPLNHSWRLVLVDREGRIRGWYDGTDEKAVQALLRDYPRVRDEGILRPLTVNDLPAVNASLNAASAVMVLLGLALVRAKRVAAHRACMLAAVGLSAVFLACYLTYHLQKDGIVTRFPVGGWPKVLYFSVLFTHTPLAAVLLPSIVVAVRHALRGDVERHRRLVRWVYPTWLYVSVTGVAVYWMLYRVQWA